MSAHVHGGGARTVTLTIDRGDRADAQREFVVPYEDHTTLVDLLEWIQMRIDPSLMFRHSCHHGSCGTCGMVVAGQRRLACLTPAHELAELSQPVAISPLPTMARIADLAVDPSSLFRSFPAGATYLRESDANRGAFVPDEVGTFVRFENCIECGLCENACPVVASRPFMGPAALAAHEREAINRPERAEEMRAAIDSETGVWGCDRHLSCSAVCPTGVYPAKQIAATRRVLDRERHTAEEKRLRDAR